jgi:hypothetical protein
MAGVINQRSGEGGDLLASRGVILHHFRGELFSAVRLQLVLRKPGDGDFIFTGTMDQRCNVLIREFTACLPAGGCSARPILPGAIGPRRIRSTGSGRLIGSCVLTERRGYGTEQYEAATSINATHDTFS